MYTLKNYSLKHRVKILLKITIFFINEGTNLIVQKKYYSYSKLNKAFTKF